MSAEEMQGALPTGALIPLAVTVERHDDEGYFWVILESFDEATTFEPLMEAAAGFATYAQALDAGVAALKNLSADPRVGPVEGSDVVDDE